MVALDTKFQFSDIGYKDIVLTESQQIMSDSMDAHSSVVAWRVAQVEHGLKEVLTKLDLMGTSFVTVNTLALTLDPIKKDVAEINAEAKAKESVESNYRAQLKLAMFVACISPILSAVFTFIITRG